MDARLETAQAHNAPLTGAVEVISQPFRRIHPTLPNTVMDADNLRYRTLRSTVTLAKSEKWLDIVRKFPCAMCGLDGTDDDPITAHHTTAGYHGGARADFTAIPLHASCHAKVEAPTPEGRELHTDAALIWLPRFYAKFMEELYGMEK